VDSSFVERVVAAAASVVASGAISANGHGNVSLRVPGADEMYYTAAPSLRGPVKARPRTRARPGSGPRPRAAI
jgi:hypothetical protein